MLYPLTPGIDIRTDTVPSEAAREEEYFAAGGAIPVGSPVMLDTTVTTGKAVIVATTAGAHRLKGVYEGKGGLGAVTAVAGLSGRAAVSGDTSLRITRHGVASSFVAGSASNGSAQTGVALGLTVINGVFTDAAQPGAGLYASVILLESVVSQAASSTSGAVKKVHLSMV